MITQPGDRVMIHPSAMQDGDSALGVYLIPAKAGHVVVALDSGRTATIRSTEFTNVEYIDDPDGMIEERNTSIGVPMTDPNYNTSTPNVVISNPLVRKWVGNILGVATVVLSIATVVDGAIAELDYANVTGPAAIIIAGILGIFQLTITSPNVPTS